MAKKRVKIPSRSGGGHSKKANQQQELMRQLNQMQKQLEETHNELAEKEFTESAGGGVVSATVTGNMDVVSVKIDPVIVDEDDIETLEDLVVAAVNNALKAASEASAAKTGAITSGLTSGMPDLKIPGL